MGGQDLSEVPVAELMAEVRRRLECQDKPEKRLILVGAFRSPRARPPRPSPPGLHPLLPPAASDLNSPAAPRRLALGGRAWSPRLPDQ